MGDPDSLEAAFKRVNTEWLGTVTEEELADKLLAERQVLCIVNTRGNARDLADKLGVDAGTYHLSALMCPLHRKAVLEKIRKRLQDDKPCRVVSTQLVEAGVDIDFPVVFRAVAGIDSIVQAAGRCNREGRIGEGGRLYVFNPESGLPPGHFRQTAQITNLVLRGRENSVLRSETVQAYFKELYWLKDKTGGLDKEGIMGLFAAGAMNGDFPFKTTAGLYRLISDEQISVIVPYDEDAEALCHTLGYTKFPGSLLRKLQPYTISLYPRTASMLIEAGYVERIQDEYHVLTSIGRKEAYDDGFGLNPKVPEFHEVENLISS
jgi:CRISPR-associated endonuclease/helicase Cas3